MNDAVTSCSFLFICQRKEQYEEMIQFFEMRKLLKNKQETLYTPIPYLPTDSTNETSLFLDSENDAFHMENLYQMISLFCPLNIVYLSKVDTTQHFLMEYDGPTTNTVCIADEQLCGRARSNRKWNSPLGCLMFSIKIPTNHCQNLVEMAPHLYSLSLILALESISELNCLHFAISYPYDIVVNSKFKICGVINEICHGFDNTYSVVGMGLHVNNDNTGCLKSLIHSQKLLSRSFILSKFLIIFSTLYFQYCKYGFDVIAPLYYHHWVHLNQVIQVNGSNEICIQRISTDGYIIGLDSNGKEVELYPDPNCEDSLSNMLARYI